MKNFEKLLAEIDLEYTKYSMDDFLADFPTFQEENLAEVTLSNHLRMDKKVLDQMERTKLSTKVGICLFLSELGFSLPKERLPYLQRISSIEGIQSSNKVALRLFRDPKFRKDCKHLLKYFIFTKVKVPSHRSKRSSFHRGYRDKGTLPDFNQKIRERAQKESYMNIVSLEQEQQEFLKEFLPKELFEGDYLDIFETHLFLQEEEEILENLKKILREL